MGEEMGFTVVFIGGQICPPVDMGQGLEIFLFTWGRHYWHIEAEARDPTDHAKMPGIKWKNYSVKNVNVTKVENHRLKVKIFVYFCVYLNFTITKYKNKKEVTWGSLLMSDNDNWDVQM